MKILTIILTFLILASSTWSYAHDDSSKLSIPCEVRFDDLYTPKFRLHIRLFPSRSFIESHVGEIPNNGLTYYFPVIVKLNNGRTHMTNFSVSSIESMLSFSDTSRVKQISSEEYEEYKENQNSALGVECYLQL